MQTKSLRQFANRYGAIGILLVSFYLIGWQIWTKERRALLVCLTILLSGVFVWETVFNHSAFRGGQRLYVGWFLPVRPHPPVPLEQRLLDNWKEGSGTSEIQALAHRFVRSVYLQNRVSAIDAGNRLFKLYHPSPVNTHNPSSTIYLPPYWKTELRWFFHAELGQIYLEQGWLDEAKQEFQSVLSAIPPNKQGKGYRTRKWAAYGLARVNMLSGSYETALGWLTRVPKEYSNGCGNANEAEAADNYPLKIVWTVASKPFPIAERELQDMMHGHFTAMEGRLNGDTSEDQKKHAAAEAGLTLGCLYYKAGRPENAESCWSLVAFHADSQYDSVPIARAMLHQSHHAARSSFFDSQQ